MPASSRHSFLFRAMEIPVALVARLFYRARVLGAERLPKTGGVLLLSNHLSYVDVIVLQLASHLPAPGVGEHAPHRA
jgi:1-acyl-sn-glycerol-3-phosphate acyltransferase